MRLRSAAAGLCALSLVLCFWIRTLQRCWAEAGFRRSSLAARPRQLSPRGRVAQEALPLRRIWGEVAGVWHHLRSNSLPLTSLEELSNTRIPGLAGAEILAFAAWPTPREESGDLPLLILIHEFYGLNPSIVEKAKALADELGCLVVAPDTFRGVSTSFVPQAIWLALTTPVGRVNSDIDAAVRWARMQPGVDAKRAAVMGFCYGGGKAIRFTTQRQPTAATVVCYGSPITDVTVLRQLQAPVCGVFGALDFQFPAPVLDSFRKGLEEAAVPHDVQVYDGVGHAFWEDMGQVQRGEQPQLAAWTQVVGFLRKFFAGEAVA